MPASVEIRVFIPDPKNPEFVKDIYKEGKRIKNGGTWIPKKFKGEVQAECDSDGQRALVIVQGHYAYAYDLPDSPSHATSSNFVEQFLSEFKVGNRTHKNAIIRASVRVWK